jgi:hypothetical protein
MMTQGRASRAGSVQDIVNDERAHTASAQGSHGGEPEEGEIVNISQRGVSPVTKADQQSSVISSVMEEPLRN